MLQVDTRQRPIANFEIRPRVVIDTTTNPLYTWISTTYDMAIATTEQGWSCEQITNATGTSEFAKFGTDADDLSGTVRTDEFKFKASKAATYTY